MAEEWEKYKALTAVTNGSTTKITMTKEELERLKPQFPHEIQQLLDEAQKEWDETRPKLR